MKRKAHGHIFCSDCQFRDWLDDLSGMTEAITYEDAEGQEQENKEQMFRIEPKRLVRVLGKRNCFKYPSKAGQYHLNMMDHTLHFWSLGLKNDELVAIMNLKRVPHFPSEFAMNTNVMKNVPRLAQVKALFDEGEKFSGRSRKLHPEQNPVDSIRAILGEFKNPETIVLDRSLGTSPSAKACLLESRHRKFIGCEVGSR